VSPFRPHRPSVPSRRCNLPIEPFLASVQSSIVLELALRQFLDGGWLLSGRLSSSVQRVKGSPRARLLASRAGAAHTKITQ
jgi:hypothetical protein